MKSRTRAVRGTKKLGHAISAGRKSVRKTGELSMAAAQVVTRRMALGATAMIDPLNADHVEFARIIPEKITALSDAGMSWLLWSGKAAGQLSAIAANEMAIAAETTVAIASCRTPAGALAAQINFATAWLSRALSHSIALGAMTLQSQEAAMAPVHRTVTANVRRLSR